MLRRLLEHGGRQRVLLLVVHGSLHEKEEREGRGNGKETRKRWKRNRKY